MWQHKLFSSFMIFETFESVHCDITQYLMSVRNGSTRSQWSCR